MILRRKSGRWWFIVAAILMVFSVGIPIGVNIIYTNQAIQHSCTALELLTRAPVPKPANPAANPSREVTYQFYEALLYWEHSDGCQE